MLKKCCFPTNQHLRYNFQCTLSTISFVDNFQFKLDVISSVSQPLSGFVKHLKYLTKVRELSIAISFGNHFPVCVNHMVHMFVCTSAANLSL